MVAADCRRVGRWEQVRLAAAELIEAGVDRRHGSKLDRRQGQGSLQHAESVESPYPA